MTTRAIDAQPFFLAAALWAALAVPLWVLEWLGVLPSCGACNPGARHAHELLAGYAWAVVAGFLIAKPSPQTLATGLGLWVLARVAALSALPPPVAALLALAFPVFVFVTAGLPFLKAAKQPHNLIFAPLIGAFVLAEALYWAGLAGLVPDGERRAVRLMLDLVALMLFAMGGRILPAATAGALRRKGLELSNRNRPLAEWIGTVGLAAAALLAVIDLPGLAAAGSVIGGAATLWRLAHWRTWRLTGRPDIWTLHLGYGWLGVGLVLLGLGRWQLVPEAAGIHAVTIGALGTLALGIGARTVLQRTRRPMRFGPVLTVGVLLLTLAAGLRLWAVGEPVLLGAAALLWSSAHLAVATGLWRQA